MKGGAWLGLSSRADGMLLMYWLSKIAGKIACMDADVVIAPGRNAAAFAAPGRAGYLGHEPIHCRHACRRPGADS